MREHVATPARRRSQPSENPTLVSSYRFVEGANYCSVICQITARENRQAILSWRISTVLRQCNAAAMSTTRREGIEPPTTRTLLDLHVRGSTSRVVCVAVFRVFCGNNKLSILEYRSPNSKHTQRKPLWQESPMYSSWKTFRRLSQ